MQFLDSRGFHEVLDVCLQPKDAQIWRYSTHLAPPCGRITYTWWSDAGNRRPKQLAAASTWGNPHKAPLRGKTGRRKDRWIQRNTPFAYIYIRSYERGSWPCYERSDRTLRTGLLASLLGTMFATDGTRSTPTMYGRCTYIGVVEMGSVWGGIYDSPMECLGYIYLKRMLGFRPATSYHFFSAVTSQP